MKAKEQKLIDIWISPVNVIELLLMENVEERKKQANIMLSFSDGKKMFPDKSFIKVDYFGKFINQFIKDVFKAQLYFKKYIICSQSIWIKNLALMGCKFNLKFDQGIDKIIRSKLESQLIHSRIIANPEYFIGKLGNISKGIFTNDNNNFNLSDYTNEEIINEIKNCTINKAPKTLLKLIEKYRKNIMNIYGTGELFCAIKSIFNQYPKDIINTFNFDEIKNNWDIFVEKFNVKPISESDDILKRLVEVALKAQIAQLSIDYYIVLKEIEYCINNSKLANRGLVLDMDHALYASIADIIICHDTHFLNNLKTFINNYSEINCKIVEKPNQVERAIYN